MNHTRVEHRDGYICSHTTLYWFHDLSSQYQTTTLKHCPNATQIMILKVFLRECDPFSLVKGTDVSPRLSVKGWAYVELEEDNRN